MPSILLRILGGDSVGRMVGRSAVYLLVSATTQADLFACTRPGSWVRFGIWCPAWREIFLSSASASLLRRCRSLAGDTA
jgi:hypothetical protein